MTNSPNKLEVAFLIFVVGLSIFSTMLIMRDVEAFRVSFALNFFVFFISTIFFMLGYQGIVNIFYIRWQDGRRQDKSPRAL